MTRSLARVLPRLMSFAGNDVRHRILTRTEVERVQTHAAHTGAAQTSHCFCAMDGSAR